MKQFPSQLSIGKLVKSVGTGGLRDTHVHIQPLIIVHTGVCFTGSWTIFT